MLVLLCAMAKAKQIARRGGRVQACRQFNPLALRFAVGCLCDMKAGARPCRPENVSSCRVNWSCND